MGWSNRICNQEQESNHLEWPKRTIPLWERLRLCLASSQPMTAFAQMQGTRPHQGPLGLQASPWWAFA